MIKKRVILLFIILLCSVSAVCATESNDTIDIVSDRDSDELISVNIDEQEDTMDKSVLSIQNGKDKSNVTVDDEILSVDNENSLSVTNQYLNDIKVSTSDEFYNFVDYLINQNGFKFNTKSTDDGYTIYSNSKYSCKLYDGETYVLPAGNTYYISKNRMSYILDEYYPDMLYSQDGNTYVDELYLGWLKWVENYHFTLNIEEGETLYVKSNDVTFDEMNVVMDGVTTVDGNSIDSSIVVLPEVFDLRNVNGHNYVTPVKDQAKAGTCWIFSSIAALESYLLKTENIAYDFSENNIKNVMSSIGKQGINRTVIGGGNMNYALAYFLRWSGPILEEFDKYDLDKKGYPINNIPIEFNNSIKHVQGIKYIHARNSSLDNNEIKQAIMDYGGVMTSLFWNGNFTNGCNYYCPDKKFVNPKEDGHAICIIGWDDKYSRNNFKYKPEGDGAFIIKNSWGNSSGNAGFYYVSYYDDALAKRTYNIFNTTGFSFTLVENNTNYGKNYNYNPLGVVGWFSNDCNSYWSQYVADDDEILKACGIYVNAACNCTVEVFLDNFNTKVETKKIALNYAGFHTISISSIKVKKGQKFLIKVTINSITKVYMPVEAADNVYSNVMIETAKTGYYRASTNEYFYNRYYDFCINVYTEYKKSFSNLEVIDVSCHEGFLDVKSKLLDSQNNLLKNFKFIYSPDINNLKDYKTVFTNNNGEAILRFTNGIKIIDNRLTVSFTVYDDFTAPLIKKTVNTNLPENVECNIESISVSYRSSIGLITVKGKVGVISIDSYGTINSLNVKGNVESINVNSHGNLGTVVVSGSIGTISTGSFSNIGSISINNQANIGSISLGNHGTLSSLSIIDRANINSISTGSFSNVGSISINNRANIGSISLGNHGTLSSLSIIDRANINSISTGSFSNAGSISISDSANINSISTGGHSNINSVYLDLWSKIGSFTNGDFSEVGSISVCEWGEIGSLTNSRFGEVGSISVCEWGEIGSFTNSRFGEVGSISVCEWGEIGSLTNDRYGEIGSISVRDWGKIA